MSHLSSLSPAPFKEMSSASDRYIGISPKGIVVKSFLEMSSPRITLPAFLVPIHSILDHMLDLYMDSSPAKYFLNIAMLVCLELCVLFSVCII